MSSAELILHQHRLVSSFAALIWLALAASSLTGVVLLLEGCSPQNASGRAEQPIFLPDPSLSVLNENASRTSTTSGPQSSMTYWPQSEQEFSEEELSNQSAGIAAPRNGSRSPSQTFPHGQPQITTDQTSNAPGQTNTTPGSGSNPWGSMGRPLQEK